MKVKEKKVTNSFESDIGKHEKELMRMRVENKELNNKIRSLQKILDSKIDMETKVIDLEKKCETLKDRCNNIEYQDTKPLEVRAMDAKISKLQEKVRSSMVSFYTKTKLLNF